MTTERERRELAEGLERMGIALDGDVQRRLLHFLDLMRKWNRVYNLTSRKEQENMVARHLLDSLALLPHLRGERVIDVGSGAGLPSIPLALACPGRRFVSLDSVAKKGRFRTQAAIELGLANLEVVTARVEHYDGGPGFDSVVSRAFASLADMVTLCAHLPREGGRFLAMKGNYPEQELADLPPPFEAELVVPLEVPYLNARRHLVVVASSASSASTATE